MSTTLVKPAEVERKWYLLDATGKSLGHVAAEAAVLLRGKQKVDYTPTWTAAISWLSSTATRLF